MTYRHTLSWLAALLVTGTQLSAADAYWDSSDAGGTWTTDTSWGPAPGGPFASTWTNGDAAIFNNSPTLNLTANVSQSGITVAAGQTLTLTHPGNPGIQGTGAITGNLTKSGGNFLFFQNTGGFDGQLTVNGGIAIFDNTAASSNTTRVALNGGDLLLTNAFNGGTMTIGELSGSAGLVRVDWSPNGTRTLLVDQATNTTYAGNTASSGGRILNLTKDGVGTLTLTSNAVDHTGLTTVSGGVLQVGNGGTTGSIDNSSGIVINAPGTFRYNRSNNNTGFNRVLSGDGILQKSGGGVLTLNANSSGFTGDVVVDGGYLVLRDLNAVGATATLALDGGKVALGGPIAGNTLTVGALSGNNPGSTIDPNYESATADRTLRVNQATNTTFQGQILVGTGSRDVALTKDGAGTLTLTGTNTYTGPTTIDGGTLQLGDGGTSGAISDASNVANDGTFAVNRSNDYAYAGVVSGSGALAKDGAGVFTLTGTNTYTGSTTIDGGTLEVGTGGTAGALTGTSEIAINAPGTFRYNKSDNDFGFDRIFSGDGTLQKSGGSILTLNADSSGFTGDVVVDGGYLAFRNANSVGPGITLTLNDGADVALGSGYAGGTLTVSELSGTSAASVIDPKFDGPAGTKTLRVNQSTDTVFEGQIAAGSGGREIALVKAGNGSLTLNGDTFHGGGITVEDGTLILNGTNNGTGAITVDPGATLGGSGSAPSALVLVQGSVAPGNSPGTLGPFASFTFAGGSAYDWEILNAAGSPGPTGWDLLDVDGVFTIADANDFTIDVDGVVAFLPDSSVLTNGFTIIKGYETGPFDIVDYGSLSIGSGTLNDVVINPGPFAGLGYFTLNDTGSLLQLTFTATVPEPGTYALLALLLLGGFVAIRRRKRQ